MFWGTVSCSMLSIEHQRSVGCRYSLIAFEGSPAEASLRSGSEGTTVSNDWQKWNSRSRFVSKSVSTFLCLVNKSHISNPNSLRENSSAGGLWAGRAFACKAPWLPSCYGFHDMLMSHTIHLMMSQSTVYAKRCQEGLFWPWLRFCIIHFESFWHILTSRHWQLCQLTSWCPSLGGYPGYPGSKAEACTW